MRDLAPPLLMEWTDDGVLKPVGRYAQLADRYYAIGERYVMVQHQERSKRSHDHFFACVEDAWNTLPEAMAHHFQTPDQLRKHVLIRCGYANSRQFVASSKAEARRIAKFVKPEDEYSIVSVNECVVTILTAQSQSYKAMGKKVFQESKDKVLEYLAAILKTTSSELSRNAQEAA